MLDVAARRARPLASEHRRVHNHVRQVVVEVKHRAALVVRNIIPEASIAHVPVADSLRLHALEVAIANVVARRGAAQWSPWCVTRRKRPLNLAPCARHVNVVQFRDLYP